MLKGEPFKKVIIDSLRTLSERGKVDVFAFVIMPNHIHLIWRTNELNGKETAQGSFLKHTVHAFKEMLKGNEYELAKYKVTAQNKSYEFWQRDSLAILLYIKKIYGTKTRLHTC